jgi:hypothetical protein
MTEQRKDKLLFDSGWVSYTWEGREVWKFSADQMILAAEWTTDHGPWGDDYFYFFLAGRPLWFFEAPMYANPKLLDILVNHLGISLTTDLVGSTDFNSTVMWPPELAGKPLFQYRPERRGPGLLNRVRDWFSPLIWSELTPAIVKFIDEHRVDKNSG